MRSAIPDARSDKHGMGRVTVETYSSGDKHGFIIEDDPHGLIPAASNSPMVFLGFLAYTTRKPSNVATHLAGPPLTGRHLREARRHFHERERLGALIVQIYLCSEPYPCVPAWNESPKKNDRVRIVFVKGDRVSYRTVGLGRGSQPKHTDGGPQVCPIPLPKNCFPVSDRIGHIATRTTRPGREFCYTKCST
jgi:hypothetical protein